MVSPRQRRDAVAWAQQTFGVTERRACRALAVERSVIRYRPCKRPLEFLSLCGGVDGAAEAHQQDGTAGLGLERHGRIEGGVANGGGRRPRNWRVEDRGE